MQGKLVDEGVTRWRRRLGYPGSSIHLIGNLQTVPVDTRGLREFIFHDHTDSVTFNRLDGGPGRGTIIAPEFDFLRQVHMVHAPGEAVRGLDDRFIGHASFGKESLDRLGDDGEDFHTSVHLVAQRRDIEGMHLPRLFSHERRGRRYKDLGIGPGRGGICSHGLVSMPLWRGLQSVPMSLHSPGLREGLSA